MKTLTLPLACLLTLALGLAACNQDKVVTTAREVGEEGAQLVEKIGPESERAGTPAVPAATITVEETVGAVTAAQGLLKLSPSVAGGVIDRWVETLRGNPLVDDNDLLVENLVYLKTLLGASPIDSDEVSEVLENLARETMQAAEDNDNKLVGQLAEALEAAAEELD